jgi:hypothetical protein
MSEGCRECWLCRSYWGQIAKYWRPSKGLRSKKIGNDMNIITKPVYLLKSTCKYNIGWRLNFWWRWMRLNKISLFTSLHGRQTWPNTTMRGRLSISTKPKPNFGYSHWTHSMTTTGFPFGSFSQSIPHRWTLSSADAEDAPAAKGSDHQLVGPSVFNSYIALHTSQHQQ